MIPRNPYVESIAGELVAILGEGMEGDERRLKEAEHLYVRWDGATSMLLGILGDLRYIKQENVPGLHARLRSDTL